MSNLFAETVFTLIALFFEVVAAQSKTGHERCQDRAHSQDSGAEDVGHHPGPDDLVNKARSSSEEKETENQSIHGYWWG